MNSNGKVVALIGVFGLACLLIFAIGYNPTPRKQQVQEPILIQEEETQPVKPQPIKPKPLYRDGSYSFVGVWRTEKNSHHPALNGSLVCDCTLAGTHWTGTFHGSWRGEKFSYPVEWDGTPPDVTGKADVDGVDYDWTGKMTYDGFTGKFKSSRYIGDFILKRDKRKD